MREIENHMVTGVNEPHPMPPIEHKTASFKPTDLDRVQAAEENYVALLSCQDRGDELYLFLRNQVVPHIVQAARKKDGGKFDILTTASGLVWDAAWEMVDRWDSERWQMWSVEKKKS